MTIKIDINGQWKFVFDFISWSCKCFTIHITVKRYTFWIEILNLYNDTNLILEKNVQICQKLQNFNIILGLMWNCTIIY